MKKAFTLIELLVVIAIIAILAAILFPVFAQAKEAAKKTTYIANVKQTGTASQIYMADVDDLYPLAYMVRPETQTWATGVVTPTPANAVQTAPWNTPERIQAAGMFWANSLQPYMKNYQLLEMPGATIAQVAGDTFTPGVSPAKMGIVMNGYLNGYSATAVGNPSVVPAFWHVQKENFLGRGFSSPAMNCPAPVGGVAPACTFGPSQDGGGYFVYDFTNTVWQYGGRRAIIGRTDSSAKSMPCGTAVDPAFVGWAGKLMDPYASVVGPTGTPSGLWNCDGTFDGQAGTDGTYWCYFRPDRTQ